MNIDKVIKALKEGMKIKLATGDIVGIDNEGNIIGEGGGKSTVTISLPCVYTIENVSDFEKIKDVNLKIVYPEILSKEEKEYLENWVRPFKKQNPTIAKRTHSLTTSCGDISRSEIEMSIDNITYGLPSFDTDTMYKGMEPNKRYTLEELGL